jgi:hypothetical protein
MTSPIVRGLVVVTLVRFPIFSDRFSQTTGIRFAVRVQQGRMTGLASVCCRPLLSGAAEAQTWFVRQLGLQAALFCDETGVRHRQVGVRHFAVRHHCLSNENSDFNRISAAHVLEYHNCHWNTVCCGLQIICASQQTSTKEQRHLAATVHVAYNSMFCF